jgi:subtilisin family serine protease
VANGIAWAAEHGAKVINLSLGGGYSLTECNAVELAINSYHAVVVAAAGNSSVATPSYPAACPGAVGVAATDDSDLPASFSNYGSPDVFLSAPGVFILSTWPAAIDDDCPYFPFEPSGYCHLDGTSMAAPHVAALAALIMSEHPEASVWQVKQVLAQSADKVGSFTYGADPYSFCATCSWEAHYGYGRINVQRALSAALPPPPATPPPPPPPAPPPPPPPASLRDTKAPVVHVYATSGRHRKPVRLRYRVQDTSGKTSERLFVYRKTKLLKTFTRALRTTDDAVAYGSSSASPGRTTGTVRASAPRATLARRGDPHGRGPTAGAASQAPRARPLLAIRRPFGSTRVRRIASVR